MLLHFNSPAMIRMSMIAHDHQIYSLCFVSGIFISLFSRLLSDASVSVVTCAKLCIPVSFYSYLHCLCFAFIFKQIQIYIKQLLKLPVNVNCTHQCCSSIIFIEIQFLCAGFQNVLYACFVAGISSLQYEGDFVLVNDFSEQICEKISRRLQLLWRRTSRLLRPGVRIC